MSHRKGLLALQAFVLLGAFLPFAMEPMVGRMLLPLFGGAFHVWTTALMFFQGALFVGYLYAHLLAKRMGPWHLAALLVPVLLLPPTARLLGEGRDNLDLLGALFVSFFLPFAALATTGVVAQGWLARSNLPGRKSPFVLYATSNAGSLAALLSYGLLVEPNVGLSTQRWLWAGGYLAFLVSALIAYRATHGRNAGEPETVVNATGDEAAGMGDGKIDSGSGDKGSAALGAGRIIYWLSLSAFPSVLLMAITNLIALDVGNTPLFWVAPLAVYLITFILAFSDNPRTAQRLRGVRLGLAVLALALVVIGQFDGTWSLVGVVLVALFLMCLEGHSELYAQRPAPRHLTLYYLVIALGGWAGGALVALVAPSLFSGLYELPIGICGLWAAMAFAKRRGIARWLKAGRRFELGLVLVAALAIVAIKIGQGQGNLTLEKRRNFYGILTVTEQAHGSDGNKAATMRKLFNGKTLHGRQIFGSDLEREPLGYYGRNGGLGLTMQVLDEKVPGPRHIGVVGLGVGSIAAYARPNDAIDFYEIDPAVVELARKHFTYLDGCRGRLRTIVGDARLTLAKAAHAGSNEAPAAPRYDLLVIDAFSGDAVPTHLLTSEAIDIYRSLLSDNGVLLFHLSNRFYALDRVLGMTVRARGLAAATRFSVPKTPREISLEDPSHYFVVVKDAAALAPYAARGFRPVTAAFPTLTLHWTDNHVNTLSVLDL
jgi:hypothetical protein